MCEVAGAGADVEDAHGPVGGVARNGRAFGRKEGFERRGVHVRCGDCGAPADGLRAVFVCGAGVGAVLCAVDLGGRLCERVSARPWSGK